MNLDEYQPGQMITSMTRRAFLDLWEEVQSGTVWERWPEGKVAQTKKERTEDMRIRTLAVICEGHPDVLEMLLTSDDWKSIEVYMGESELIHFRVLKDMMKERRIMVKRR